MRRSSTIPGSPKRGSIALLVEPMRRWRDWQCRTADLIVTPTPRILPAWLDRRARPRSRVGRRHERGSSPARPAASRSARDAAIAVGLRRCVPRRGTARPLRRRAGARSKRAARPAGTACSSATAPNSGACRARSAPDLRGRHHHRRPPARARCPPRSPPPTSASPRSTSTARAAARAVLLVAAQGVRIHGRRACRSSRPTSPACARSSAPARRACCTIRTPGRPGRRARLAGRPRRVGRAGARPRGHAPCVTSAGTRTAERLEQAIERARQLESRASTVSPDREPRAVQRPASSPTPSRPSAAAAAGARTSWRAACARAATSASSSSRGPGEPPGLRLAASHYDGFAVHELGAWAPGVPFVRNYFKNERLTATLSRGAAANRLTSSASTSCTRSTCCRRRARSRRRASRGSAGRRHGPRLLAGLLLDRSHPRSAARRPLSGLLAGDDDPLRPAARRGRLAAGAAGHSLHARESAREAPRAGPCRRHHRRQLRDRARSVARAPELAAHARIEVIPNPVDLGAAIARPHTRVRPMRRPAVRDLRRQARAQQGRHASRAGSARAPACAWPLVVVGDGPSRDERGATARAASGLDVAVHRLARRDAGAARGSRTPRSCSFRLTAPSR